jgi:quercetin dioxygenase-like cupin family protein
VLKTFAVVTLTALAVGGAAMAQTPNAPIKRNVLFKIAVPNSDYEVITAEVEIAGGFRAKRHLHPGAVDARITEGEFWLALDGQPEKIYTAGQTVEIPDRAVHDEGAANDKPVKFIATYVVKKGEPMVQPVK